MISNNPSHGREDILLFLESRATLALKIQNIIVADITLIIPQ
jgi:hypothetical protein